MEDALELPKAPKADRALHFEYQPHRVICMNPGCSVYLLTWEYQPLASMRWRGVMYQPESGRFISLEAASEEDVILGLTDAMGDELLLAAC